MGSQESGTTEHHFRWSTGRRVTGAAGLCARCQSWEGCRLLARMHTLSSWFTRTDVVIRGVTVSSVPSLQVHDEAPAWRGLLSEVGPIQRGPCAHSLQWCLTLRNPMTVAHWAPPSMGFSRQEYWSRLPFPFPGELHNPGIEPRSPALQADALTSEPPGNLKNKRTNVA